jgi:hypothetical protein
MSNAPADRPWPVILPTSDYDLQHDVVHKHYRGLGVPTPDSDDPAVTVPGYGVRFQLASESPPHLWPHNAKPLGFEQYIPGIDPKAHQPKNKYSLSFKPSSGQREYVHFAFLYK